MLAEGLTALAAKVNEQQPVVDRLLAAIYADNAQAIHVSVRYKEGQPTGSVHVRTRISTRTRKVCIQGQLRP